MTKIQELIKELKNNNIHYSEKREIKKEL